MSRYHSYINNSVEILSNLQTGEPLNLQLKKYFSLNKKFGSNDRKIIATLCYQYFRIGNSFKNESIESKIAKAHFICSNDLNSELLAAVSPELNQNLNLSLEEKLSFLGVIVENIFPFTSQLSCEIDKQKFLISLFTQPNFFLRLRPGFANIVFSKLKNKNIFFEKINDNCIAISPATKLDNVLDFNKEVAVQDLNSQKVLDYLNQINLNYSSPIQVWDSCAASGGKSILIHDLLTQNIKLTVSDIRPGILKNLKQRLSQAGINISKAIIADLSSHINFIDSKKFDIIICDVPCTGSGTWGRTPEQINFSTQESISSYTELQQKIASNTFTHLKENGLFFYITCSVFENENEMIVKYLSKKFDAHILQMQYLKGYETKSDSMFVAVLKK